jgi:hypothetical protein
MYMWHGTSGGGNTSAMFQNGGLVNKVQFGLSNRLSRHARSERLGPQWRYGRTNGPSASSPCTLRLMVQRLTPNAWAMAVYVCPSCPAAVSAAGVAPPGSAGVCCTRAATGQAIGLLITDGALPRLAGHADHRLLRPCRLIARAISVHARAS